MDKQEFEQRFGALLRQRGSDAPASELKEAVAVATWYVERRLESFAEAWAYFDNASVLQFIRCCYLMGISYQEYHNPNNATAVFHAKCVEQIRALKPGLTEFQLHMSADGVCNELILRGISFVDAEPNITIWTDEQVRAMRERDNSDNRMQ